MASQMSSQVREVSSCAQPPQRSTYRQKSITRRHENVILIVANGGKMPTYKPGGANTFNQLARLPIAQAKRSATTIAHVHLAS